jgi:long-chain acyl-CoA synthetase
VTTRQEALQQLTAPGQDYEIIEVEANGRPIRAFKNAPQTLGDIYAATRSDATFLVYEDERLTFEQTFIKACTLADALIKDYGVAKGDRVAISMRNYPEWMIAFSAITSIGAIAVAMNSLWSPDEMAYGLENSGSHVLIADQERLDRLAAVLKQPAGLRIIAVRTTKALPTGAKTWDEVLSRPVRDAMPSVDVSPDDDAIMLYTSGSTGYPKGAVSTHRNVISAMLSWELDYMGAVAIGLTEAPKEGAAQGAILLGIPLFHVTGMHYVFLMAYRGQRRIVSMYKWDANKAADIIEQEKITNFAAPAAMTGDLVEVARTTDRDLSSLTNIGGGGAARAPEQVRAIAQVFANAAPGTGWGMTETNAIGTAITAQNYLDHPESSGQCSAVLDMRIVAEDGTVLGVKERGELQVRGASIMRGYWNRPDANADTFTADGWMRTGDVAYFDEEGFIYIVDRIKEMVIRGGENIGCGGVEAALLEHPMVVEACVYGVPDERLGEEVGVTLYVSSAVPEMELRAFLEPRLSKFQIPRYIHFEHEPLPRIASGKILRRQVREEAVKRLTRGQAAE